MKKLALFVALVMGALLAFVLTAADFSKTYDVGTRKDYVKNTREDLARISYDFDALITHYNAARTGLQYGYINIPLASLREVDASGDVGAIAVNGGLLASDSTPLLSTIGSNTTQAQKVEWAASNNDPVMFQVALPYDYISTADLILEARVSSDGTTDALYFTASGFFNEADTGTDVTADAAVQSATYATTLYTFGDVTTDALSATIILTPAAHTTNKMYLSNLRLKYERNF